MILLISKRKETDQAQIVHIDQKLTHSYGNGDLSGCQSTKAERATMAEIVASSRMVSTSARKKVNNSIYIIIAHVEWQLISPVLVVLMLRLVPP
jgi:hypothetical protein